MMLLEVTGLSVAYGGHLALSGFGCAMAEGGSLGLVGESGCGKSTAVRAMLRLLPQGGRTLAGKVMFKGRDLLTLPKAELRRLRWREIALVPQSSLNSLNPVLRVGDQVAEAIRLHESVSRKAAWERAGALLQLVGIDRSRLADYPHQLSGGMRQRIAIAAAIALTPSLVVADEPTTALDVVVQDRVLDQLMTLRAELNVALLLISHDLGVVAETCRRMIVMYAGTIVEAGDTKDVLAAPGHPYTMGLRHAFPDMRSSAWPVAIPGSPPAVGNIAAGCPFAPRCPFATPICSTTAPPLETVAPGHQVACHARARVNELRAAAARPETWERVGRPAA